MIYTLPTPNARIDQGDLIDACPCSIVTSYRTDELDTAKVSIDLQRGIVLTQTCDLANEKVDSAIVATVFEAAQLVSANILKAADVKGPLRAGRVWGLYFLPAQVDLALDEMIIDLRRLHMIRLDILTALSAAGKRRARLSTPYREHLGRHFADTFSRIGLPGPYETL